jgi:4-amino-4-deoxy-L-arabinose transferase-like glycosyltransferase
MGMLNQWMYALEIGNPQKLMYSLRFPTPIFYLIELTWPYGVVHPISLFIYIFGLLGLGVLLWRRKPEDKFLLIWFFAVYIFFTLIGNKQWRYVVPIFPVLAISAASLMTFAYGKTEKTWNQTKSSLNKKRIGKVAAGFLIATVAFSVGYSCLDAYHWVAKDTAFNLPGEQATNYVAERLNVNESMVVLCALNVFSQDTVKFYLYSRGSKLNFVGQYPELPVDTYTPYFSVDELIGLCTKRNVKYLLFFEYGETYPYFNSTLNMQAIYQMLMDSQKFTCQASFGNYPCRIFVLSPI